MKLVDSANESPVSIALNSDLGFGKTFFLDHLKANLEENKYPVFKFNSWEYDLESDAFIAIINCLIPQLLKFGDSSQNIDKVRTQIVGAVSSLACAVITAFIPQKFKEVTATALEVKKEVDKKSQNPFVYAFPECSLEEAKQKFKDCLKDYRCSLVDDYKDKPIVFIIDELDRCRPDFAIKVLECVKHLFDVEGYCFIFGVCCYQLNKSIQHVFGSINVDIYLRRFFDYKLNLPNPNNKEYWDCLFSEEVPTDMCFKYLTNFVKDSEGLISLRDIDQLARNYELISKLYKFGVDLFSIFSAISIFGLFVAPNFINEYLKRGTAEWKGQEQVYSSIFNKVKCSYIDINSGTTFNDETLFFVYLEMSDNKKFKIYYDTDNNNVIYFLSSIDKSYQNSINMIECFNAAYKLINSLITN